MIESFKLPTITPEALTGSIVSFNDEYGNLQLKSCTSLISGYQEGSGIPSPDNVRPLVSFSSATLTENGNTHTFTFGQSIYIGYIDWERGVVVGYKTLKTLNGSEDWYTSGSAAYLNNTDAKITNNYGDVIANSYSEIKNWTDVTSPTQSNYVCCIFEYSTWNNARFAFSLVGRTKAEFISDLQSNNIVLAYELAEPIEIPLGGINLLTQEGQNNIFCNIGDTTLEWLKVN